MKQTDDKTLNVAVVGLGKMGMLHASILSVIPNVKMVAVCEKSSLLLRFAKKLFKDAKRLNDIEKLTDIDLDAVFVTTPIPIHFPIIKFLYTSGVSRNLFVEKTLSHSWVSSKELCELAEHSGGINMVGFMKRFGVTFLNAKNIIDQGLLGDVKRFKAYAYSSDFSGIKQASNKSASRGGVLGDLGSHVIDLSLWFFGTFEVESSSPKSNGSCCSNDNARFMVRGSDLEGDFDISWCKDEYRMPDFGLSIEGQKGTMRVNDDILELNLNEGKSRKWYRHDLGDNVDFLLGAPEYYREDENFVDALHKGRVAEPSFRNAAKVDYIIDQVCNKVGNYD